jgi:hypothetical protein
MPNGPSFTPWFSRRAAPTTRGRVPVPRPPSDRPFAQWKFNVDRGRAGFAEGPLC